MDWEVIVIGAAFVLLVLLGVWRFVLQIRIVKLFLRRLFGLDK
ncbi:MAG TPA: hypothetical protein VN282_24580 [Pyrinomonadaceae bacterium]|nr:hypothetical protein [Pyrinomonadaceae bacterium]